MTPERIARLRELGGRGERGEQWYLCVDAIGDDSAAVVDGKGGYVCFFREEDTYNAVGYAQLVSALPELLDEVERLQGKGIVDAAQEWCKAQRGLYSEQVDVSELAGILGIEWGPDD